MKFGLAAIGILTCMSSDQPDIKPRSRDVTDGLEKTAARGMLRAVGMGDDDWVKPQIGVGSSWNEICLLYTSPSPRDELSDLV